MKNDWHISDFDPEYVKRAIDENEIVLGMDDGELTLTVQPKGSKHQIHAYWRGQSAMQVLGASANKPDRKATFHERIITYCIEQTLVPCRLRPATELKEVK